MNKQNIIWIFLLFMFEINYVKGVQYFRGKRSGGVISSRNQMGNPGIFDLATCKNYCTSSLYLTFLDFNPFLIVFFILKSVFRLGYFTFQQRWERSSNKCKETSGCGKKSGKRCRKKKDSPDRIKICKGKW